jgi:hypothetical protein
MARVAIFIFLCLGLFSLLQDSHAFLAPKSPMRFNMQRSKQGSRNIARSPFFLQESTISVEADQPIKKLFKRNIVQRWITGLSLGGIASLWIASGSAFTLGFLLITLITQSEYDVMLQGAGIQPSTNFSLLASFIVYLTAYFVPMFHEITMPLSAIFLIISMLVFRDESSSISDMSASLMGIFYLGYMPSFWIRLRNLPALSSIVLRPVLQNSAFSTFFSSRGLWGGQAAVMWFTWASIVFSGLTMLSYSLYTF